MQDHPDGIATNTHYTMYIGKIWYVILHTGH